MILIHILQFKVVELIGSLYAFAGAERSRTREFNIKSIEAAAYKRKLKRYAAVRFGNHLECELRSGRSCGSRHRNNSDSHNYNNYNCQYFFEHFHNNTFSLQFIYFILIFS